MSSANIFQVNDRNQDATLFVGELEPAVTEALLWELFLQAGPVVNVYIPKDKVSNQHTGYGFVELHSIADADYALKIMNGIKLFGRPIRVNKSNRDKRTVDIGANLFIGNLDPDVDENALHQTFSTFGAILQAPKIMRDPETGASRGFAFISYDSFEASDAAVAMMNGQFINNRAINVSYAMKKDGKGERHGTEAERLLAKKNVLAKPTTVAPISRTFMSTPQMPRAFTMPQPMAGGFAPGQAPIGLAGPMGGMGQFGAMPNQQPMMFPGGFGMQPQMMLPPPTITAPPPGQMIAMQQQQQQMGPPPGMNLDQMPQQQQQFQ